jgi:hypothetical protein
VCSRSTADQACYLVIGDADGFAAASCYVVK